MSATIGPVKRRKPKALRKEEMIRIRVTAEQKRLMTEAAERTGLDVSAWLRVLGLRKPATQRFLPDADRARGGGDRRVLQ